MQHPIEELMHKKGNDPNQIVGDLMYVLMRDLHLGYRDIKRMPLCDILELTKRWSKEQKETEKQMKKKR
jgi:hypothetical protein